MIELIHALITSLLLSTAAGFGVASSSSTDEEDPASSETGTEVGQLPQQLAVPRTPNVLKQTQQDDHQPTALVTQVAFCEPAVCVETPLARAERLPLVLSFTSAGRSP